MTDSAPSPGPRCGDRHTQACAQGAFAEPLDGQAPDLTAQGLRPVVGGLLDPPEREQEFLPAVAPAQVFGAGMAAQQLGHRHQGSVPGQVAETVVDLLEVVDVQHDDGHRHRLLARPPRVGRRSAPEPCGD